MRRCCSPRITTWSRHSRRSVPTNRYPDQDRFDIRRNPVDHLGFGYGVHGCAGQGLARIEVHALIGSLLRRTLWGDSPKREHNLQIFGGFTFDERAVAGAEEAEARFASVRDKR